MADGDCAAVDVYLVEADSQFACDGEGLHGEGFVEFEEIDVADGPSGAGKYVPDSGDGGEHDPFGGDAAGGLGADDDHGLETELAGAFRGHEDHGGCTVVHAGSVAGGYGPVRFEGGTELGKGFE